MKTRFYLVLLSLSLILCSAGCLKMNYYESNHVYRVNSDSILLSFDDGPTENTAVILDILKEHGVQAAFFLTGANAQKYPELVKQIAEDGHYIGNHTFSHPRLTAMPFEEAKQEIQKTQNILGSYGDKKWFRPTFGELPYDLNNWLKAEGYTVVRWSAVRSTELKPGDILLLHETDGVVQNLPNVIKKMNQVLGK